MIAPTAIIKGLGMSIDLANINVILDFYRRSKERPAITIRTTLTKEKRPSSS
jgi:hypothetical protein